MAEHIDLLSEPEVTELYAMPHFNEEERKLYFAIENERESRILNIYSSFKTRVYFILQLGYFKAKHQFFDFVFEDVPADVKYVLSCFVKNKETTLSGCPARHSINEQKRLILKLLGYQGWSSHHQHSIELHIGKLLRYYPKGHNAFRELLNYFDHQQIVIPSYRTFQTLFTKAYALEEKRINQLISSVPAHIEHKLSTLINRVDGVTQLNIMRSDQKDFNYTAVRAEIDKAERLADLYEFAKKFLPTLKLSKNAIRYYADVVEQYAAFRLRRISKPQQFFHALCFVYHRYQEIMDNLITSFLYHVHMLLEAGKTYADVKLMEHSAALVVEFPKLAQFLEWFLVRDKGLSYEELNQIAYGILPKEQFPALALFLKGNTFDKTAAKWEFYLKSARMFSLYLRPILMALPLTHYKKAHPVMELIQLIKNHYGSGKGPSALKLSDDFGLTIPKHMIPYLKRNPSDQYVDPYLFEFFVYQKVCHQIDRGFLCCNDSVSYCDIDQDLVDDTLVDKVEEIANEFGYSKVSIYCNKRLDEAIQALDQAWEITTENIRTEANTGLIVKETKEGQIEWSLLYDSSEPLEDSFFKTLPQLELANVMMFMGDRIHMWESFTHLKDRYVKRKKPVKLALNGCLMSEGFGIGEQKMAEMSDLNFNLLRSTREDFIRISTLCAANDRVSNHIHGLPIFHEWDLLDDKLLADADGQKFATSNSTIQSRYSKKYLGKGKGISLYTLVANFIAVNAKNIGLNEYEGHALFDMIYSNKTDIEIDMVTGDNHSLNQLNFVALDAIDVEYVPSIKNVREAADNLYSIKPVAYYTGLLKPKKEININRIRSEERGIIRVLLSLIMQENTQTHIIRKLNSHARYVRLRAALFEYNRLFQSTHLLNLINGTQLRKALRSARNRTESYHQLQGFIRKVYYGIFKGKRVVDNRISAHAARLIANCIVAYNSIILNTIYEKMIEDGVAQEIIDEFARISPIAWAHILFTGRYSFKKSDGVIDIAEMAKWLEMQLKQRLWKVV